MLYAIDPGETQSAMVMLSGSAVGGQMWENDRLVAWLSQPSNRTHCGHLVIEEIQSFGMPVGREVFSTVFWSGRFAQAWSAHVCRCLDGLGHGVTEWPRPCTMAASSCK